MKIKDGETMEKQIHGGDIYRHPRVTDFSVNTNPLGTPEAVLRVLREQASQIMNYPDMHCETLRNALARYEHMDAARILCGNGAAELFYAVTAAVRPKRALLLAPTFSEYEKALNTVNAQIVYYPLKKADGYEVQEDILESINTDIDMVFICHPNNPTGLLTNTKLLHELIFRCEEKQVVCVLDECFLDFLENHESYDMKLLCESCAHLIIVKAMTKIFCMPGLRLGYALSGNLQLLKKMRSMLQAWNVSVLAQLAGVAALEAPGLYLKNTRCYVKEERAWMMEKLKGLGYTVYDSKANYLFFEGPDGLYEKALSASFLIRDCQGYVGLSSGAYRIAVRTHEENERILKWLRQL